MGALTSKSSSQSVIPLAVPVSVNSVITFRSHPRDRPSVAPTISIPKQLPAIIPPSLSTGTPRTPPHHPPPFACPPNPPAYSCHKRTAVVSRHSNPDLATFKFEHVDWHRRAVHTEELVQSCGDLDVGCEGVEDVGSLWWLVLLEANVGPGWIA